MAYNLARIRNRVIVDKLDDEEYDTTVVDNFINDTIRDIFTEYELPFMEKIYSGTIPAGVTMFSLPTDVSVVHSHVMTSPEGRQFSMIDSYVPFKDFNERYPNPISNEPGGVSLWTSFGGKMLLARPTDGEYKMDIFYIKKPTYLALDGDVPDVPEEFEELLVLGAYMRVQKREGDSDEALLTEQEYNRKMLQLVNRYGMRMTGPIKMRNRQVSTRYV